MASEQLRMKLGQGPICGTCAWRSECRAAWSPSPCPAVHGLKAYGGRNALHPHNPVTALLMNEVGGPGFDDVPARPTPPLDLGQVVPQIRPERVLRGQLLESVYCVSSDDVIGKRSQVLEADAMRDIVGLESEQTLVLELFGKDPVLERLWAERRLLLPQLAAAGYAPIVGPSCSLWVPRPRPEHLIALKRSLLVFAELQKLGAPTLPRVAWEEIGDAGRLGRWVRTRPMIGAAGLDLTTYTGTRVFQRQLRFLRTFDRLTCSRLHYWIRGPSTSERWTALFSAIEPARITLTNAETISCYAKSFATKEGELRTAVADAAVRSARLTASGASPWLSLPTPDPDGDTPDEARDGAEALAA
jgi:hypothetical protein